MPARGAPQYRQDPRMGTGRGAETPGLAPGGVHGHSPPPPCCCCVHPRMGSSTLLPMTEQNVAAVQVARSCARPHSPWGRWKALIPHPAGLHAGGLNELRRIPPGGGQPQGSAPRGPTAAPHPGEGVREPHRSCALSPRVSGTRQGTELRAHPQWIPPLNPSPSAQQSGSANQPPDPT